MPEVKKNKHNVEVDKALFWISVTLACVIATTGFKEVYIKDVITSIKLCQTHGGFKRIYFDFQGKMCECYDETNFKINKQ